MTKHHLGALLNGGRLTLSQQSSARPALPRPHAVRSFSQQALHNQMITAVQEINHLIEPVASAARAEASQLGHKVTGRDGWGGGVEAAGVWSTPHREEGL